jgi:hypothetical protein
MGNSAARGPRFFMSTRINSRLTSLFVTTVLILGMVWYMQPDSGVQEFRRCDQAMRNARSWRIHRVLNEADKTEDTSIEVYCPSKYHVKSAYSFRSHGKVIETSNETVDAEGYHYSRNPDGVTWTRITMSGEVSGVCSWGPRGVDEFLGAFDAVIKVGKITKGTKRTVNGSECRQWTASVPAPGGQRDAFIICIGNDDLPLEVRLPDGSMVTTYSDWNQAIEIDAPDPDSIVTNH